MFEHLMMSLRMKDGLSLQEFENRYHQDLIDVYAHPLQRQIKKGMLVIENGFLHATHKGMLLLNDVLVDFLDD